MDRLSIVYRIPSPYILYNLIKEDLKGCTSVLDIGCGERPILKRIGFKNLIIIGVDAWPGYHPSGFDEFINADICDLEFKPKEFDLVLLSDSIEHIPKNKIRQNHLISKIRTWGRKSIIITPEGFMPMDAYDENCYQRHESGWTRNELQSLGYDVKSLLRVKRKSLVGFPRLEIFRTLYAVKGD